ncbi:CidA/LrgA family protein [Azohydromonas caseinilytica]|uniref:CidA/LrgA family protein n=1 Tax=Azohydromonas caseinilytica TaxID=2728836 RepID=A0A848F1L5_9BURK|nr:CidA/LrgA family protein [Azohydromonas caseinilytica]NML13574.1 CidA/LrgA family protein [Azohydromonas caseinilytica]
MQALRGLALLLLLQALGEILARAFALPLPGPVLGLALLLPALRLPPVREPVAAAADMLLTHLSLLFVPVGVGVITHLGLLSQYGLKLLVAIVLSTWIGMAVTALVLRALLKRTAPQPAEGDATDGTSPGGVGRIDKGETDG